MPNNKTDKDILDNIRENTATNKGSDKSKENEKAKGGKTTTTPKPPSSKTNEAPPTIPASSSTPQLVEVVPADVIHKTLSSGFKQLGDTFKLSMNEFGEKFSKESKSSMKELGEQLSKELADFKEGLQMQLEQEYEEQEYEEYEGDAAEPIDEGQETGEGDSDFLDSIALNDEDHLGPDVGLSLARLAKKFLTEKIETNSYKKKVENYKIPKNVVEAVSVPAMNPPVYEVLSPAKRHSDLSLQKVQKDMLLSALPIFQLLDKLVEVKEDPGLLDPEVAIKQLTDSLAFLGSANTGLLDHRKLNIKGDLPQTIQPLVKQGVVSPRFLFGDDLSAQLKEVSELTKMSSQLHGPSYRAGYRGGFRGTRGRSSYRRGSRRGRGRWAPYNSSRGRPLIKRRVLNKQGPSNTKL